MTPELKQAIERLRCDVQDVDRIEVDAVAFVDFKADILAVCSELEKAMRVVEAAKATHAEFYIGHATTDDAIYCDLCKSLAALEES